MRSPRSEARRLSVKSNRYTRRQTGPRVRERIQFQEFEPANNPDEELGQPAGDGYTPGSSLHPLGKIPSTRTQGGRQGPRRASTLRNLSYSEHRFGGQVVALCAAARSSQRSFPPSIYCHGARKASSDYFCLNCSSDNSLQSTGRRPAPTRQLRRAPCTTRIRECTHPECH